MFRLVVALVDGTVVDEEFPNHQIEEIEIAIKETNTDLLVRAEIEDNQQRIVYTFTKEITRVY